jgi:hypothetical protein
MHSKFLLCAAISATVLGGMAIAEPYVDYTPQEGAWHITTIKVDPNHIDDYLTGLRREWAPGEEIAKKHGVIDSYRVMVKMNSADGQGNVILVEHIPSMSMLEADQMRDQSIQKEVYLAVPKMQGQEMVRGFDKYRNFVGDDYYTDMTFAK